MNNYFYQLGGSLPIDAPSYVRRQTDQELFQLLKEGQFCYVLNCRQMGKSSSAIKICQQLRAEEIACDIISLDTLGGISTTSEQWYGGIIRSLISAFMPSESFDLRSWWHDNSLLSPVMRLREFIEKILLRKVTQSMVIFYDEVDSILSLNFNNDDFFTLTRYFYNQRAINPDFNRLTFAFLGVASPSDLIKDSTKTPFNIGHKIELQGFKIQEVEPLREGLEGQANNTELVMQEILFWTGGQPFLTQKLCKLVSDSDDYIMSGAEQEQIEKLVKQKIITNWENQDHPQHLKTIKERIEAETNNIINLLENYRQILEKGSILVTNIDSEVLLKLRISGLVVQEQNQVKVYNEIYRLVFNSEWIDHQIERISPYGLLMNAWFASNCTDHSQLLRGKILQEALKWSKNKTLNARDYQYFNASQQLKSNRTIRNILLTVAGLSVGILGATLWYNNKYAFCPIGERISNRDKCIRYIYSSGEKSKIFLGDINFYLDKGSENFNQGNYERAEKFFDLAISADPTDPVPLIYWNNTQARLASKDGKGHPLKLAVVAGIDFYEGTAKEMLRGVADAQNEFNHNGGKNGRLLEIVIVNDGNEPDISKKVAENLANRQDILGIIGHHASESSEQAIKIYEKNGLAMVSPTSSSSELQGKVFFRNIQSTKEAAKVYMKYIKDTLHSDRLVIFSDSSSIYSKKLKNDFIQEFNNTALIDINQEILNQEQTDPPAFNKIIDDLVNTKVKTVFLMPSIKTSSIMIALARAIRNDKKTKKLNLLFAMSMYQQTTLDKGGNWVNGISLATPCINENHPYIRGAKSRWLQKAIYWRTASSYDATQALIEAINLSSNNPTRDEILNNLKSVTLPVDKTSGFGLEWSKENPLDHFNIKQKYCIYKIENNKFEEVPEK